LAVVISSSHVSLTWHERVRLPVPRKVLGEVVAESPGVASADQTWLRCALLGMDNQDAPENLAPRPDKSGANVALAIGKSNGVRRTPAGEWN
jgi:hypothetical protein